MKKLIILLILPLVGCAGLEHAKTKMSSSKTIYLECLEMFPEKAEKCEVYLRTYVENIRGFILKGEETRTIQVRQRSVGEVEILGELDSARVEEIKRQEELRKIVKNN